jgi:hypothetical protein
MKKIAADRNYLLKEAAEYKGRKVSLRKPFRTPKGPKKFSVYVRNKKGNVIKVNFGDPDMEIKRDDPDSRRSFRARHKCSEKKDETKPGYWSCKMWGKNTVKSITKKKKKKAFEEIKMKKIAADRNYRMFKRANDPEVGDEFVYESRIREIAHDLKTLMEANQHQGFNAELKKAQAILDQPVYFTIKE